jgi:cytochrome c
MGNDPLLLNKVAAAVLSAALLAMLTGFIAKQIYHPRKLENPAYEIAAGVEAPTTQTASAPSGPGEIGPLLAKADPANGEKAAKKCAQCHSFEKGGPNKIGPNLWNIVGAKHAAHEGYSYSGAMQSTPGNWDYESLNMFLYNPRAYISGTKMTFAGVKNDQERADIIAYLQTLVDNPNAPSSANGARGSIVPRVHMSPVNGINS